MQKILFTMLLFVSLLVAKDLNYSSSYSRCIDNSGGVTSVMNECNADELQHQDVLLNRYYKGLMSHLSSSKKAQLKKAQRLCIKYRNANCGFYTGLTGGTIDIINAGGCHVDMTVRRAGELKEFLLLIGE
jgi:uncharacterized protein YecT (DUF1311 family)